MGEAESRSRRIQLLLATAMIVVVISVAMRVYLAVDTMADLRSEARGYMEQLLAAERAFGTAQLELSSEMGDWRDMLLDMQDQTLFQKHYQEFVHHAEAEDVALGEAKQLAISLGLDSASIEEMRKAHRELASRYQQAVRLLDARRPDSIYQADKWVVSDGRALQLTLTALRSDVSEKLHEKIAEMYQPRISPRVRTRAYLILFLNAVVPFVIFWLFWLVYQQVKAGARADERARAAFESIGDAVICTDKAGRVEYVNRTAESLLGWKNGDALGQSLSRVFPVTEEITGDSLPNQSQSEADEKERIPGRHMLLHGPRGESIPIEVSTAPVRGEKGEESGVVMVFHDDRQQRELLRRVAYEHNLFQSTFEQMPLGALLINAQTLQVISSNLEASRLLRYMPEEMSQLFLWNVDRSCCPSTMNDETSVLMPSEAEVPCEHTRTLIYARQLIYPSMRTYDSSYIRKDGSEFPAESTLRSLQAGNGEELLQVVFRDISEKKRSLEQIEYLALHDPLTGLSNRNQLQQRVKQAQAMVKRHGGHYALLFVDLDHFKTINDTMGHEEGDALLMKMAERLKNCMRAEDTLCRAGGDEFILLLNQVTGPEDAAAVAEKIVRLVSEEITLASQTLMVTPSIGISIYPQDGEDYSTLFRHADMAMYQAKEGGRNGYRFFSRELDDRMRQQVSLENDLRAAIDKGQLELYYQPRVSMDDGTVAGCEALMRWHHPVRGIVSPQEFIPVAERSNLILLLGEWVVQQVCWQVEQWEKKGVLAGKISFNLSARDFAQRNDIVGKIGRALTRHDVKPSMIEVELTESLFMDPENSEEILRGLHALGVSIALDDFGTGYSSLAYLRRFPIHTLKVDRSFVQHCESDPADAAMVQTIISIAHQLGMTVVAEGVETEAQRLLLLRAECLMGQGYLFARPMTASALEEFLLQRVPRRAVNAV